MEYELEALDFSYGREMLRKRSDQLLKYFLAITAYAISSSSAHR